MVGQTAPAPAWKVIARRDREGVVYHLDDDGLWWTLAFSARWAGAELEEKFGPTTPVDVDRVEVLLADHARLSRLLEEAHTTIRALVAPAVFVGPRHRRRTEAADASR